MEMTKNSHLTDITNWAKNIGVSKVFLLTNRDIKFRPTVYGEDYYINTLIMEIEKAGVKVEIAQLCKDKIQFNGRQFNDLADIVSNNSMTIIHNPSPYYGLKSKLTKKVKVVVPVYFINNKVASIKNNLKSIFGIFLWQFFIDEYIVASPILAKNMRRIGVHKKVTVLQPHYACQIASITEIGGSMVVPAAGAINICELLSIWHFSFSERSFRFISISTFPITYFFSVISV